MTGLHNICVQLRLRPDLRYSGPLSPSLMNGLIRLGHWLGPFKSPVVWLVFVTLQECLKDRRKRLLLLEE